MPRLWWGVFMGVSEKENEKEREGWRERERLRGLWAAIHNHLWLLDANSLADFFRCPLSFVSIAEQHV